MEAGILCPSQMHACPRNGRNWKRRFMKAGGACGLAAISHQPGEPADEHSMQSCVPGFSGKSQQNIDTWDWFMGLWSLSGPQICSQQAGDQESQWYNSRKSPWCFIWSLEAGTDGVPAWKPSIRQEEFPLTYFESAFLFYSSLADWMMPIHNGQGNLLYPVYWFIG